MTGPVTDDFDRLGVPLSRREIHQYFTLYDLKRLDSYSSNLVDYHVVLDLLPLVSRLVFTGRLPIGFSAHQYSTLVGVGLQHKRIEDVAKDLGSRSNSGMRGGMRVGGVEDEPRSSRRGQGSGRNRAQENQDDLVEIPKKRQELLVFDQKEVTLKLRFDFIEPKYALPEENKADE